MRRTQAREGLPLLTIGTSSRCLSLSVSNGVLWIPTSFVLNLSTHLLPPFPSFHLVSTEPAGALQSSTAGSWGVGGWGGRGSPVPDFKCGPGLTTTSVQFDHVSEKLSQTGSLVSHSKTTGEMTDFFFPPNCCVDTDSNLMVRFIEPLLQRAHLKKFFF